MASDFVCDGGSVSPCTKRVRGVDNTGAASIVLLVSSVLLQGATAAVGAFAIGLGVVHLAVPVIFRFPEAIGTDAGRPSLGAIRLPLVPYRLRRSDLRGITWVMSNAASYVLVTIGIIDLAWVAGWRGVSPAIGGLWIAGWWGIRAGGQLAIGCRRLDRAVVAWFGGLAALHVVIAIAAS
jgi:hypothetical protein